MAIFGSIIGAVAAPVLGGLVNGIFGGGGSGGGGGQQYTTNTGQSSAQPTSGTSLASGIAGYNAYNNATGIQQGASGQAVNALTGNTAQAQNYIGGGLTNANTYINNATGAATNAIQGGLAGAQQSLNPYIQAGNTGLSVEQQAATGQGQFAPFTMADATNSTAEQYALQQALGAQNNAAALGGTQLSAGNIMALQQNAAGVASQYQGQAFNQYMAQNQQALGTAQGLAGLGANASSQLAATNMRAGEDISNVQTGAGTNLANLSTGAATQLANTSSGLGVNLANQYTGLGNAVASNTLGAANALAGGVSNFANQPGIASGLGSAGAWAGGQVGNLFGLGGNNYGTTGQQNYSQDGGVGLNIENQPGA